eukprot:GFYU01006434.1.p1 GENE.GFYU01006434.1~~GFYU01006434.1.p1  ORF type:complete len:253 (-),score=115.45 GFYU01006434.1:286-1044(-)
MYRHYAPESESIYNLITREAEAAQKPPMYRSKHTGISDVGVGATFMIEKKSTSSFGKPKSESRSPKAFLRKREKDVQLPEPQKFQYSDKSRKPQVPNRSEKPIMGLVTTKDFITNNAVENILAVPRKREEEPIRYINKPDYGKTPQYLDKVKNEIEAEYSYLQSLQEQLQEDTMKAEADMYAMTENDKRVLVNGLKAKWQEFQKQYQSLSFVLDTASKRQRKEYYEKCLADLEASILKLESKRIVLVQEDRF